MVVVDSSVLILLSRISKLFLLKKYFKSIKITQDIYEEVREGVGSSEIEEACKHWIRRGKPKNLDQIDNISKLEGIETADASIIQLANEKKDILLSNDYALIMVARSKGIETWWLTTFILRCLEKRVINKKEAKQLLFHLVGAGMHLSNEVYAEILRVIENK